MRIQNILRSEHLSASVITSQAMHVQRNTDARSCNHCCIGKAISITYCACIILSSVTFSALQYFPHYLINGTIFEKKVFIINMSLIFSTKCVWNISYAKKNSARCYGECKYVFTYPLFSSDFNGTWVFSTDFRKNTQISNFVKIRPVVAEQFHADGRTDRDDKTNSRFLQFCECA